MGKIYCKGCRAYLGNVEGKIHKKITYLCPKCNQKREALELRYNGNNRSNNDISDVFRGIFDT